MSKILFGAIILFGSVFLANYLATLEDTFHVGKDNGLEFKIFSLCVCASLYYYILGKKPKFILTGFLVGLFCYLIIFIYYIVGGIVTPNTQSFPGNIHTYGNNLVAAGMVFIIGILFFRKRGNISS